MEYKDFTVFILTHGRPDNVKTFKTLKKAGYTGRIYPIIDNEDKTAEKYYENFGKDNVIMFDKKALADNVDEGNNFDERRTITHARNACFKIAKNLGIEYFMQMDDDYYEISYKLDNNFNYRQRHVKGSMDSIFDSLINYYNSTKAKSIAFAQCGDFIGGVNNGIFNSLGRRRKCMNTFLCSVKRPFKFVGAMNEDVNTYTTTGSRGNLFLTFPNVAINQEMTQSQNSGITEMYLKYGTYCKAFTTVMMQPSSVKVKMMGNENPRLHHSVKWKNTVPMIIRESNKK